MKPAEIITVAVSVPLIAALMVSELAASYAPALAVRTANAQDLAVTTTATASNEIVVIAKRVTKG